MTVSPGIKEFDLKKSVPSYFKTGSRICCVYKEGKFCVVVVFLLMNTNFCVDKEWNIVRSKNFGFKKIYNKQQKRMSTELWMY